MSRNVLEWCNDWYGSYSSGAHTDPTGPTSGSLRVVRGGGWDRYGDFCRSAFRVLRHIPSDTSPYVGFRLAR